MGIILQLQCCQTALQALRTEPTLPETERAATSLVLEMCIAPCEEP